MRAKPRICLKCRKSTRGKEWIESCGIRICMDCLKKASDERKLASCKSGQAAGYNEVYPSRPAEGSLPPMTSDEGAAAGSAPTFKRQ